MTAPLRFATWNVNSIRARTERLIGWLQRADVDVVALQETKATDGNFPYEALADIGYEVAHHGFSQWNGVAIVSRVGLEDVQPGFADLPPFGSGDTEPVAEARAIGATCGGIRIWSLYVPHGRAVDDPHYIYKLAWLEALRADAAGWLAADPQARIALTGDFNIAPTDADVYDATAFAGHTHVTEPERAAFRALNDAGYTDVVRPFTAAPRTYTYWDYQQLRFPKNRGMRIDFALCSPALAAQVTGARIDREERKGKGASDHAPVIVEIAP
ncbi:MAG: exodeoxyribonuclease III [Nakamurella sp.]